MQTLSKSDINIVWKKIESIPHEHRCNILNKKLGYQIQQYFKV